MREIWVVAQKEVREAWRSRIFVIMALLFLTFSVLSVYIGSSTKHAEMQAYNQTISLLKASGNATLPLKPDIPPLAILINNISYISMIGAILAVFLGFDMLSKEKEGGNLRLVLSRPLFRDQLLSGKLLSGVLVIAALQVLTTVFDIGLLRIVGGMVPTISELGKLCLFGMVSFVYMMLFFVAALTFSGFTSSSEATFLGCITLWISTTFVLPQLAETQKAFAYSTAGLTQTLSQVPQDTAVSQAIQAFSPAVHYERIGNLLLQGDAAAKGALAGAASDLLYIVLPVLVLLGIGYWRFVREEMTGDA